jgi:3'-phosphoadenosine 5'-phosphosulfate sulfotransferase (PAPS reductase)/FAD synthetase
MVKRERVTAVPANQIVSLSGGKDSTAMLLTMLEYGESIHSVVFFDTGWEFPQMHEHLALLEKRTGIPIVRLKPRKSYNYWLVEHPVVARKGPNKGKVHRIGYGRPSPMRRWCTKIKTDTLRAYARGVPDNITCIGYAAGEEHRTQTVNMQTAQKRRMPVRFPLIEYGMTEPQALDCCLERSYDWGGLYGHFDRVSCFCCPLQGLNGLRKLRIHFPRLWKRMRDMGGRLTGKAA